LDDPDQQVGVDIVSRAIRYPARLIADNAGLDGSVIVGKLLETKDTNQGFDAQAEKYVNMIKAGIIDPTKVVRIALEDSASVAGLLITTEAMIADKPEPKAAGGGAPDMGDMGGMGGGMGF
jgi:chaperonin GroEL